MAIVTFTEGPQGMEASESVTKYAYLFGFGSVFATFIRAPLGVQKNNLQMVTATMAGTRNCLWGNVLARG